MKFAAVALFLTACSRYAVANWMEIIGIVRAKELLVALEGRRGCGGDCLCVSGYCCSEPLVDQSAGRTASRSRGFVIVTNEFGVVQRLGHAAGRAGSHCR